MPTHWLVSSEEFLLLHVVHSKQILIGKVSFYNRKDWPRVTRLKISWVAELVFKFLIASLFKALKNNFLENVLNWSDGHPSAIYFLFATEICKLNRKLLFQRKKINEISLNWRNEWTWRRQLEKSIEAERLPGCSASKIDSKHIKGNVFRKLIQTQHWSLKLSEVLIKSFIKSWKRRFDCQPWFTRGFNFQINFLVPFAKASP